ncbi:ABC transporter permease subunit [Alicyclobacillus sp. TC]|uniref:ABC-type Na+ efflux pump permease subunit n=1 Tax=Alicyclobacillus tolerans TaxID=90970 RepID=A0ABT9LZ73_9BACL|nr:MULTISPECIES: ABC transporter permease subunit [Alicyclobacillus]MDP9729558.1 ABC-type Na+ efflux pump permease subunit [Alicyclobacillus tengchongensis]QRF23538.1 ABC transporter permease subunit [Alicyclobacillus sp. TC]
MSGISVIFQREFKEATRSKAVLIFALVVAIAFPIVTFIILKSQIHLNNSIDQLEVQELHPLIIAFLLESIILATMVTATSSASSFAGEREHGTLEALLLAPISESAIFVGKVLAHVLLGVILCCVTILSSRFASIIFISSRYKPYSIGFMLVLALLSLVLSTFVVGICTIISTRAKSTRIAQQLSTLVMFPVLIANVLATNWVGHISIPHLLFMILGIGCIDAFILYFGATQWRTVNIIFRV